MGQAEVDGNSAQELELENITSHNRKGLCWPTFGAEVTSEAHENGEHENLNF